MFQWSHKTIEMYNVFLFILCIQTITGQVDIVQHNVCNRFNEIQTIRSANKHFVRSTLGNVLISQRSWEITGLLGNLWLVIWLTGNSDDPTSQYEQNTQLEDIHRAVVWVLPPRPTPVFLKAERDGELWKISTKWRAFSCIRLALLIASFKCYSTIKCHLFTDSIVACENN